MFGSDQGFILLNGNAVVQHQDDRKADNCEEAGEHTLQP